VELLREITVDTPDNRDGSTARITLWHGDLTRLEPEQRVELLLASAFPDNYETQPDTLIGALYRAGVSVEQLAREGLQVAQLCASNHPACREQQHISEC
jgi:hypothetical protein